MKNLFKVLLIAAATTAFIACENELDTITNDGHSVRTVNFSASTTTKTVFGTLSGTTLPTLWTENETVGISLNLAAAKQSSAPVVASGGTTATFSVDIDDSESSPYTFYAISPFSSIVSVNSSYKSANINIPSSQTPLENSVDEAAQILIAKHEAGASFPSSSVTLDFDHLTAYIKFGFSNLALATGESVASVSLTAAENWAGRYYYYFEDNDTQSEGDLVANSATSTISLITNKTTDIWMACAPVDLRGKNIDVVITTNKGTTYSKQITIPTDASGDKHLFKSGKVSAFTINMSGITADSAVDYTLVKNVSELTVGSEVVIAAYGQDYAISTTQNTNNWVATAITPSSGKISSPSAAVQIFTVESGNQTGSLAFYTGSAYICAQSAKSNYMRAETNLTDYSSWDVTIDSSTGEATVVSESGERNNMRFNPNNGNPIFSCYASTSSVDTKVCFYKKSASETRVESEIAWSDDEGLGDVKNQTLELPSLANPHNLAVSYSSSDETVATVLENAHTITLLEAGETQIHAIFAGDNTYKPADVYYTLTVDDTRSVVTLSFGTASYALTIGTSAYDNFTGQAVTANPSVAVTYALTGAAVGSLNASTGAITLDDSTTGTATITASFAGNATHKPAEDASYTIVVSPGDITEGDPWYYTFTSNEFDNKSADLTYNSTTLSWSSSIAPGWANDALSFGTNNSPASATLSTSSYTGGVSKIAISIQGNSKKNVTAAVSVGGTALKCDGNTTVTQSGNVLTEYEFVADVLVAGEIVISFTNPSGGYQIKTIKINPEPKTLTSIEISGQTTSFTKGDTFSFGGTVTAYYSDNSTTDVTSSAIFSGYNMSTTGEQTVTVSYTEGDVTKTTTYTITVSESTGSPTLQYTLDGTDTTQGSNGYATDSEITQSSIDWIAVANTTINPWRFGGKSLTGENRAVYSTTAIASNISSIEVESGTATATVNSLTITVHNSAADAASGSNAIATKSVTSGITSSTVTLTKTGATSWAGKYYRIVYNVTCGGSNQYVQFKSAKFYGTN